MSNEERFAIAYWDWMRKLRRTEPGAEEFGLCACKAEALARDCHYEFEKTVVKKQQSKARHGRSVAHHATRG